VRACRSRTERASGSPVDERVRPVRPGDEDVVAKVTTGFGAAWGVGAVVPLASGGREGSGAQLVRWKTTGDHPGEFDQAVAVPHSLSYQARIFTCVPSVTIVEGASMIPERGSSLKSTETSGARLVAEIPVSGPSDAARSRPLTSSDARGRATSNTQSVVMR